MHLGRRVGGPCGDLGYPVLETDFGRVGIGICMDIHYPEMWRIYALDGADILLFPTMCLDYTGDHIESIVNARAIDNQVYLVSSHFVMQPFLSGRSMGHSRIVDPSTYLSRHLPFVPRQNEGSHLVHRAAPARLSTLKEAYLPCVARGYYGGLTRLTRSAALEDSSELRR